MYNFWKKYQNHAQFLRFLAREKYHMYMQVAAIRHASFPQQSDSLGTGLMKHVLDTHPRVGHHGNYMLCT